MIVPLTGLISKFDFTNMYIVIKGTVVGTETDGDRFLVVANHFKSKSASVPPTGDNADTGDGQGAYNGDRIRQAQSLATFVEGARRLPYMQMNAYELDRIYRELSAAGVPTRAYPITKIDYQALSRAELVIVGSQAIRAQSHSRQMNGTGMKMCLPLLSLRCFSNGLNIRTSSMRSISKITKFNRYAIVYVDDEAKARKYFELACPFLPAGCLELHYFGSVV